MTSPVEIETTQLLAARLKTTFELNAPSEGDVLYRMTLAKERARLSGWRRQRLAPLIWGAAAAFLISGSALAVAVQTGAVHVSGKFNDSEKKRPELVQHANTAELVGHLEDKPDSPLASPSEDANTVEAAVAVEAAAPSKPARASTRISDATSFQRSSEAPATPDEIRASWERVAHALQKGDDAKAHEEARSLAQSTDPQTRDGARLVQLRIELGGEVAGTITATAAQRALAEELTHSGATPSIRASSRRLLMRMTSAEEK